LMLGGERVLPREEMPPALLHTERQHSARVGFLKLLTPLEVQLCPHLCRCAWRVWNQRYLDERSHV
jgi:hypothetical protein